MPVLAYIVRHGFTDLSPAPEFWAQVPLNALGRAQARESAEWLKENGAKIKWGVSSDLKRAEQTLAICAKVLDLKVLRPVPDLRAVNDGEDDATFEARNLRAFTALLQTAARTKTVGLIACHRSNTAYLSKMLGGIRQKVDYTVHSMVHEGGLIEVTDKVARPVFDWYGENAKASLAQMNDGTDLAGFVTAEDNPEPRRCGHCKWMDGNHCDHPAVTADDGPGMLYGKVRNKDGKWIVAETDCCNGYQAISKWARGGA